MVDYKRIKQEFAGLVGFSSMNYASSDLSSSTYLARSILTSKSGAYFQEAHPLINIAILESLAPKIINEFDPISMGSLLQPGQIGIFDGKLYQNISDKPITFYEYPTGEIEQTSELSIWLRSKIEATYVKVVQTILSDLSISNKTRDSLVDTRLYKNPPNLKNLIPNVISPTPYDSQIQVGFIIKPIVQKNIKIILNSVSITLNKGINFEVQLVSSNWTDLYGFTGFTKPGIPTKLEPGGLSTFNMPIVLSGIDLEPDFYWVLYYTPKQLEAQQAQAINNKESLKESCRSCNRSKGIFDLFSFIEIIPFEVEQIFSEGQPDYLNDAVLHENMSYGLNLDLSVVCDYTELFTEHKASLVKLIQLQFAVDMLREYVYNPNGRVNRAAALASRADIIYALDGDQSKFSRKTGLSNDLAQAYKAINLDLQQINGVCVPCNRTGIRYNVIAR